MPHEKRTDLAETRERGNKSKYSFKEKAEFGLSTQNIDKVVDFSGNNRISKLRQDRYRIHF